MRELGRDGGKSLHGDLCRHITLWVIRKPELTDRYFDCSLPDAGRGKANSMPRVGNHVSDSFRKGFGAGVPPQPGMRIEQKALTHRKTASGSQREGQDIEVLGDPNVIATTARLPGRPLFIIGCKACDRLPGTGNHNFLAGSNLLKQLGEVRLGFMDVDLHHIRQSKPGG